MFPYKLYNRVDLCTQGQFKCVQVFFINIVNNSFSKFSKDVNSILIFVGWNNSLLNSMLGVSAFI